MAATLENPKRDFPGAVAWSESTSNSFYRPWLPIYKDVTIKSVPSYMDTKHLYLCTVCSRIRSTWPTSQPIHKYYCTPPSMWRTLYSHCNRTLFSGKWCRTKRKIIKKKRGTKKEETKPRESLVASSPPDRSWYIYSAAACCTQYPDVVAGTRKCRHRYYIHVWLLEKKERETLYR